MGSGVYVDVENLEGSPPQRTREAQEVIKSLLEAWPNTAPKPVRLILYVRADQSALWTMWAGKEFPEVGSVCAKGVQHFSKNHSKNSADIALAMDAIADIVLGRVSFIAVVSDDSDFISLYCKLRDEKDRLGYTPDNIPFLWILTDRTGTRSDTVNDFFPATYTHVVPFPKSGVEASPETARTSELTIDPYEDMAIAIIRNIPVGRFKSTDCRETIQAGWPDHNLATANEPTYGTLFYNRVFPHLEERGVTNPSSRPRRYEMTQAAKATLG